MLREQTTAAQPASVVRWSPRCKPVYPLTMLPSSERPVLSVRSEFGIVTGSTGSNLSSSRYFCFARYSQQVELRERVPHRSAVNTGEPLTGSLEDRWARVLRRGTTNER